MSDEPKPLTDAQVDDIEKRACVDIPPTTRDLLAYASDMRAQVPRLVAEVRRLRSDEWPEKAVAEIQIKNPTPPGPRESFKDFLGALALAFAPYATVIGGSADVHTARGADPARVEPDTADCRDRHHHVPTLADRARDVARLSRLAAADRRGSRDA